jgi:hypothetical protein
MATRLESGQVQLRSAASVPMERITPQQIDYVAPRAEARKADAMAQILDRMSQSTFQRAAEMREQEAYQFAADTPPTQAQLELAADGLPGAIPGADTVSGDYTVFGRALKKARSLQIAGHFEVEGRNQLTKLLVDVQSGKADPKDISTKIATMTDGYAKSLSKVDGEAALKFRANMATHGNTILSAAYEAESKRNKVQNSVKFDMDYDNSMQLLEATISQGFFTDSNGEQRSVDDLVAVIGQNISTQALLLGDLGMQKEYSEKFRLAVRTAKIGAVSKLYTSDEYMLDTTATLNKIRSGDAGKLSQVFQSMDFDSVAKVTANYMAAVNERETIASRKREAIKLDGQAQSVNLLERIFPLKENNPERKRLIAELTALPPGSTPIGTLEKLLEPQKPTGDGDSNSMTNYNALGMIFSGAIKTKEDLDRVPGLSIKDRTSLLKVLYKDDKSNDSALDRSINKLAELPETSTGAFVLDQKSDAFKKRQSLKLRAAQIENDAIQKGKPITTPEIIQQLEAEALSKKNSEDARQARKRIDEYVKGPDGKAKPGRDWITGPITKQSIEALRRQAGTDPIKLRQVRDMESLLKQAEGN